MSVRILRNAAGVGGMQYFVDDWLISSTDLTRVWYPPEAFAGNPVAVPDLDLYPWQTTPGTGDSYVLPFSGGFLWNPDLERHELYYYASRTATGRAISVDGGETWTDHEVVLEHLGEPYGHDSEIVFRDENEPNANHRYKMLSTGLYVGASYWHQKVYVSPTGDSGDWTYLGDTGPCVDRTGGWFDPFRNVWVHRQRDHQGPPGAPRHSRYWEERTFQEMVGNYAAMQNYFVPQVPSQPVMFHRGTTETPVRWDPSTPLNDVDNGGTPGPSAVRCQTEYNFDAAPCESMMIGIAVLLSGTTSYAGRPKLNECYLVGSRDGFHFSMLNDGQPWIKMSTTPQHHLYGNVQSVNPVVQLDNGQFVWPVSGRAGIPGEFDESGVCSMSIFRGRQDGMCSMNAASGAGEKTLTTKRVRFLSGSELRVNIKPTGPSPQVRAEVLDPDTLAPIANYTRATSSVASADGPREAITFGAAYSALNGTVHRLKFYVRDAELFAFGVTDGSGDAGGFIHQGRP